ncbi:hypothetical protein TNCT_698971, partial [Trichonephila clavata]
MRLFNECVQMWNSAQSEDAEIETSKLSPAFDLSLPINIYLFLVFRLYFVWKSLSEMGVRTYNEELHYLEKFLQFVGKSKRFRVNMKVEGIFYVNAHLEKLMFDELRNFCRPGTVGGFLPGMKQIGNVAALPGIVS